MHYIDARRKLTAALLADHGAVVLVAAGDPIGIPGGQDQLYPFFPHPFYYWLTGSCRPGGILAYDPQGGWTDFRVPVSNAERVWEGARASETDGFPDVASLADYLAERASKPLAVVGAPCAHHGGQELSARLSLELNDLRRAKDEVELALMRRAISATAAGFACLPEWLKPGVSEREVGIRLEAEFFLHGCQRTGYGTIVGSGTNSAVLHWPPTERKMQAGEIVLVDAGGAVDGYTADVTRVFAVDGRFSARQQELYDLLLGAQVRAVEGCRVGVEWGDLHVRTALQLADGLRGLGVLKVSPEEAVESEVIALFFPHGLGHMLGLGVRDASGLALERSEVRKYAGANLRMDLPLKAGYIVTVEPGLYFIPALLQDPEKREQNAGRVAWDALDPWLELGGMRIEDNLLIRPEGPLNLTEGIPK